MDSLFSIGQKVVCVDSSDNNKKILGIQPPLIEGKEYTIKGLIACKCGSVSVDVGLMVNDSKMLCCCKCNGVITESTLIHWCSQHRFIPLDFDRQADAEIQSALNESLKIKI